MTVQPEQILENNLVKQFTLLGYAPVLVKMKMICWST